MLTIQVLRAQFLTASTAPGSVMHSCALVDFPLLNNFILRSMFTMLACQQKQQCSSSEQLSVWVTGCPSPLKIKYPHLLPLNKLVFCMLKSVAKKVLFCTISYFALSLGLKISMQVRQLNSVRLTCLFSAAKPLVSSLVLACGRFV